MPEDKRVRAFATFKPKFDSASTRVQKALAMRRDPSVGEQVSAAARSTVDAATRQQPHALDDAIMAAQQGDTERARAMAAAVLGVEPDKVDIEMLLKGQLNVGGRRSTRALPRSS